MSWPLLRRWVRCGWHRKSNGSKRMNCRDRTYHPSRIIRHVCRGMHIRSVAASFFSFALQKTCCDNEYPVPLITLSVKLRPSCFLASYVRRLHSHSWPKILVWDWNSLTQRYVSPPYPRYFLVTTCGLPQKHREMSNIDGKRWILY